ncbi:MAG: enoyl-CoA hydratase/isomerase family protein, partial [Deltaproteobacteria bacterium]|nr:enoyl-CoA hydratase/isomerase family protein [Deltaproteobacteria bacterium]
MTTELRFHKVEKKGNIVIWKFSNPPRNLHTSEARNELHFLVEMFDKDPDLKVGILTSAVPGMFIQHFDVSILAGHGEQYNNATEEELEQALAAFPPTAGISDRTSKIVICAINGPAQGGGFELALSFDFRFISSDSFMGLPEVDLGIIPGGGGTQRLSRLLGMTKAMELCLTGMRIPADEAEKLGLVTKTCDPEDLMPTVLTFAESLAKKPPLAVFLIKQVI